MKKRILSLVLVVAMLLSVALVGGTTAPAVPVSAEEEYPLGDFNMDGDVTTEDARCILQACAEVYGPNGDWGVDSLYEDEIALGDVNQDGDLTTEDARLILKLMAELITKFPSPDDYTKNSFVPGEDAAGKSFAALGDLPANEPETQDDTTKAFGIFALTTERNAGLPFNVACNVTNKEITALLPAGVDVSALVVDYTYYGDKVLYNGEAITADMAFDFTKPVTLTMVAKNGSTKNVTVKIETLNTGLPSMAVTLENYIGADNIDHDEYSTAMFYLGGGTCDYAKEENYLATGKIKGRGNSSWALDAKKSYTVKLDKKAALLDMAKSKNWALVANYEDKSLLRNVMAQYVAEEAGVPYVMQVRPVDMWFDGVYWGTYNLTEKIEIEEARVNITDTKKPTDEEFTNPAANEVGYLMEFDAHVTEKNAGTPEAVGGQEEFWRENGWDRWEYSYTDPYDEWNPNKTGYVYHSKDGNGFAEEIFFQVPNCNGKWIIIKKPSLENLLYNEEMRVFIFRKVMELDLAIRNHDMNKVQALLDIDSFARWAIVEEMFENVDSTFHSSVYMSVDVNGKFTFGPAWDFDRSSGNCEYSTGSVLGTDWGRRIFDSDAGKAILKNAWLEFKSNTADWETAFDARVALLGESYKLNFQRWDILGEQVYPNPGTITEIKTWRGQTKYLKDWLRNRYAQLDGSIMNR